MTNRTRESLRGFQRWSPSGPRKVPCVCASTGVCAAQICHLSSAICHCRV